MNILFIHQNFPGQFRDIARILASNKKHSVLALRQNQFPVDVPGVSVASYRFLTAPLKEQHRLLGEWEAKCLRGEAVAEACRRLKLRGWNADVVIAHPGWGESLFVKDIWPSVRVIHYLEYFYRPTQQDYNFDPEFLDLTVTGIQKLRLKNTAILHALSDSDAAWTATEWQRQTFPEQARSGIRVIHEGVDFDYFAPNPNAEIKISGKNITLSAKDEVITFASRSLEPVRGFHAFMRALPALLKARPNAHVVIMGSKDVVYGQSPKEFATWTDQLMAEVGAQLDPKRVHLVGFLPKALYRTVLQISSVHVYLTYPFILSWSMIEAMACGAPIVASNTPPVQEVLKTVGQEHMFDFFDTKDLVKKVDKLLRMPARRREQYSFALRELVKSEYSLNQQTAHLLKLLEIPQDSRRKAPLKRSARRQSATP